MTPSPDDIATSNTAARVNPVDARSLCCSVVIPVFNRSDLLRAVLHGLAKQTASAETFEVLVCDDGSTQPLDAVVAEFTTLLPHLRHLRQINRGPAAARNLGILNASTDIVVFLDSDVEPGDRVVSDLVAALQTHPDWQGTEAKLQPIGGEDSFGWDAPRSDQGGHYHTAGIAYRRDVLERVGGLDENFSRAACEDVELAVRVLRHGAIGFVPTAVVYHPRRRRTTTSTWKARENWRYVQMLACRHGFLGWPGNTTSWPRLRTAACAAVTLPAGRALEALRRLGRAPADAMNGLWLAAVDWVAGMTMLPAILFARLPEHRSQVGMGRRQSRTDDRGDH